MPEIHNSENAMAKRRFDAIVIGSGASGGWAAKELTQKGLKVLMLERGNPLEHVTGYTSAFTDPWDMPYRGNLTAEQKRTHPFLIRDYPYGERNESYWFKDVDAPYSEVKRFDWYRPDIVGGKSIMWGRQSYRLSDKDFNANIEDGHGIDWPIRYKDIAPWYDYVERHVGISGENLGLEHFPDQQLLPPMDLNCVEKAVKERIESIFSDRKFTIGRAANLTQPHDGRGNCQYRNLCDRGCPFGAYFSTQSSTLPHAVKTKKLTLLTNSMANSIVTDPVTGKATGVLVINTLTGAQTEYNAKVIFVCASAMSSTWLLLNSQSARHPKGLGNSSGVLGHYLMDHHFRCGANGTPEGFEDRYQYGRRPNGVYVPRYRNVGNDKRDYVRGFGFQGGASRAGWQRTIQEMGFGASLKEAAAQPGPWSMGLMGFGEVLPYYENHVRLNTELLDKWGQPTLTFDAVIRKNEEQMRQDMMNDAAEMLEAAGMKDIKTYDYGYHMGMAIHEMGTARMGRDVNHSILNEWNQVHECKNVFVTDGACMTSAACVNPTLTYMALTARAADFAVKELKKKNL